MRAPAALAALILTATTLTACGSSGGSSSGSGSSNADKTDSYCAELKADKKYFESLDSGDVGKFDAALEKFHTLADKAPSAVADDWKVLDTGISKVQADLKAAGVTFEDLAKAEKNNQAPKGVDAAKLQKVVADFQTLTSTKAKKASDAIEKHAKTECKVDLGNTSG